MSSNHLVLDLSFIRHHFRSAENQSTALERYQQVCPDGVESLVSCSDDFTLYLWRSDQSKCIMRMTGHQNVVNDVKYSPDVKYELKYNFKSLTDAINFSNFNYITD